jgi:uncharacterized protein
METQRKLKKLKKFIWSLNRVVVAFSGGVDSTLLLKVCVDVLGREKVLAFIGASPVHPARETREAINIAGQLDVEYVVAATSEMENAHFTSNPRERCYYCKSGLLDQIKEVARDRGITNVVEGSNIDDEKDFRPGSRAVDEKGVLSPLRAAGLTKQDIRELSRMLSLPTHDKPSFACLASRIPYGTRITADILKQVELSEEFLKNLGLKQARVRYHGNIARIEVEDIDIRTIIEHRHEVHEKLKALGFSYVALDLKGYRTGSMNEALVTVS